MHPVLTLLVLGCAPELTTPVPGIHEGGPFAPASRSSATGSQTLVDTSDRQGLYVLDGDTEAVLRYDPAADTFTSTPLDAAPGRITRANDRVWVTLPADRAIAVLRETDEGLVREGTIETGAEPLGIVARADGERVYVALATEGEVRELDAGGTTLRTWALEGQPSWLALHPDGGDLYVGHALGGGLSWIDLDLGTVEAVTLPDVVIEEDRMDRRILAQRVTGDLAVSPDGTVLAAPMLATDNRNEPPETEEEVPRGYGSSGAELSNFNPMVALVEIGENGEPRGDEASMVLTVAHLGLEGMVRSYLASVAISPEGDYAVATMEASSAAIAVPIGFFAGGVELASPKVALKTGAGPRGVAFLGQDVYVDTFLDRSLSRATGQDIDDSLPMFEVQLPTEPSTGYGPSPLDPDHLAGRALFYSATSPRMAETGAGVSCSTCHPSGRTDGLVWALEQGDRQTPSLAGGISATAPFTWAYGVGTVAEEAVLTATNRMGGRYLGTVGSAQVAAYVESIRAIDVPALDSDDEAVLRGRALFQRADVGCTGCHYGALYTDNDHWPLFGMAAVNTPSLRRVSATAPYLHDGRAETLREVLELSVNGAMGDTSMLSEAELDDLEAYLRSL